MNFRIIISIIVGVLLLLFCLYVIHSYSMDDPLKRSRKFYQITEVFRFIIAFVLPSLLGIFLVGNILN